MPKPNDDLVTRCYKAMCAEDDTITCDRIVCDPRLRDDFLCRYWRVDPAPRETNILLRLLGLRKGGKLAPKKEADDVQET